MAITTDIPCRERKGQETGRQERRGRGGNGKGVKRNTRRWNVRKGSGGKRKEGKTGKGRGGFNRNQYRLEFSCYTTTVYCLDCTALDNWHKGTEMFLPSGDSWCIKQGEASR